MHKVKLFVLYWVISLHTLKNKIDRGWILRLERNIRFRSFPCVLFCIAQATEAHRFYEEPRPLCLRNASSLRDCRGRKGLRVGTQPFHSVPVLHLQCRKGLERCPAVRVGMLRAIYKKTKCCIASGNLLLLTGLFLQFWKAVWLTSLQSENRSH